MSLESVLRFAGTVVRYLFRSGTQLVNVAISSVTFCLQEDVQSPLSSAAVVQMNNSQIGNHSIVVWGSI